MSAPKPDDGAEKTATDKPKSKKKLVIIAVALLLVLGGAGGYMALGKKKPADEHAEAEHEEVKTYERVKLETFIVNLSQSGNFLKTSIVLEFDPKAIAEAPGAHGAAAGGGHGESGGAAALPGILGEREPIIRDAIIRVLSSKKGDEVLTATGKDALKEELVEAINESIGLDTAPASGVYFNEFIVQ